MSLVQPKYKTSKKNILELKSLLALEYFVIWYLSSLIGARLKKFYCN